MAVTKTLSWVKSTLDKWCHPREGEDPTQHRANVWLIKSALQIGNYSKILLKPLWIPAFAGMTRFFFVALMLLITPIVGTAGKAFWQIVSKDSVITFTATQNGSPVSGQFKDFSGEINFDPKQLNKSNVGIVVDVGSISTSYGLIADTLKTTDWFNVKLFPRANFTASTFTKTGDKSYESKGTLTIRDKTLPLTVAFILEEYSDKKIRAKGTTIIKRTAFGVGQGDWADTKEIKDEVQINFALIAVK